MLHQHLHGCKVHRLQQQLPSVATRRALRTCRFQPTLSAQGLRQTHLLMLDRPRPLTPRAMWSRSFTSSRLRLRKVLLSHSSTTHQHCTPGCNPQPCKSLKHSDLRKSNSTRSCVGWQRRRCHLRSLKQRRTIEVSSNQLCTWRQLILLGSPTMQILHARQMPARRQLHVFSQRRQAIHDRDDTR